MRYRRLRDEVFHHFLFRAYLDICDVLLALEMSIHIATVWEL